MDHLEMPAAAIGPENPLPLFRSADPSPVIHAHDSIPPEDREHLGWETAFRVLPHKMQDAYQHEMRPRKFVVATLENEHLRAVVLPELGGRLASLVDKQSGLELLESVTEFRPANIALRNAWFAGGVEWNTAQMGHHYLTCSPMFAARIQGTRGEPALRLYAWERTKRFPFQIDLHLPPDSRFLFARVRVINPHESEIPMYWWTNIAVPQSADRRTLVPAESAIHNVPGGFELTDVPMLDGMDLTYGTNHRGAKELFFKITEGGRPWIACLDGRGEGLVHVSTARLKGRKMFVWGTSRGGQRWQEHLLGPDRAYLEIQGGLARTQIESVPMPPKTDWAWTEAFGLMRADPDEVHSSDWRTAYGSVEVALDSMLPREAFDRLDAALSDAMDSPCEETLFSGDGWGSLEQTRAGSVEIGSSALAFPEELIGPEQAPWLSLLRDGALPERDPLEEPGHYMVQPEWRALLEDSIRRGASDHWLGWLHLGVMKLEAFDAAGARDAWTRSIEHKPSAWAYRNLAVLENREGNLEAACDLMGRAWEIGPELTPLALEYADLLERSGRWDELRSFVAGLSEAIRCHERVLIVSAKLALHFDDLSGVEEILSHEFATIREGEVTLTDLWFAWQAKLISEREGIPTDDELMARVRKELTPPMRIDLRMAGG